MSDSPSKLQQSGSIATTLSHCFEQGNIKATP